jgi:hypothetical protein
MGLFELLCAYTFISLVLRPLLHYGIFDYLEKIICHCILFEISCYEIIKQSSILAYLFVV